jgi:hypothetical protein
MKNNYSNLKHLENLQSYFVHNRKFFNELADYYKKNNLTIYSEKFVPLIENESLNNNNVGYNSTENNKIICPYCKKEIIPKITYNNNMKYILIIVGILLAPVIIGIILIIIAICLKVKTKSCPECNMTIQKNTNF